MMISKTTMAASVVAILIFSGCNKGYPKSEGGSNGGGSHLRTLAVGLGGDVKQPLVLDVDGETYELFESGLFERDASNPRTGVRIATEPSDGHCVLFESYADAANKMASCVPSAVENVDATVSIGRGWTYKTHGSWRVMYSPEQLLNPVADENGTVGGEHPAVLAGTFYDSGLDGGDQYLYALPGAAIGTLSKDGLDTALRDVLLHTDGVVSIKRIYTYSTDTFLNTEYTMSTSGSVRPAKMIGRAAQRLHGEVLGAEGIEADLEYIPSSFVDTPPTTQFRVATTVLPYSANASLYVIRLAPESSFGENHFPTTNIGSH